MIGDPTVSKAKPAKLHTQPLGKPEPFVYVSPQKPDRIVTPIASRIHLACSPKTSCVLFYLPVK